MSAGPFDRSVLKVTQVVLITCLLAGYAASLTWSAASWVLPVLAAMMVLSAVRPGASPTRLLYVHLLRPRGWVRPRVVIEDAAPHRFAQLVGGIFLVAASLTALAGAPLVAWTLGWIVVALAFLNFAFDVCVGCIAYAQLVRVGLLPLPRRPTSHA
jgi:hypothetical protein